MPAIQITRLRIQVVRLLEHFSQPAAFARALAELLDFYADRARRPGKLTALQPIHKQYRVHPAVLKQIETELAPLCREDPPAALALADTLWGDLYHEPRLLAVVILSLLPDSSAGEVLERLARWARAGEDRILVDALLDRTSTLLIPADPGGYQRLARDWMKADGIQQQSIGLRALVRYVRQVPADRLPEVFKQITPLPVKPASYLLGDLQDLVAALYARSPGETMFYLQGLAAKRKTPDLQRFLRGCQGLVSGQDQAEIRKLVE